VCERDSVCVCVYVCACVDICLCLYGLHAVVYKRVPGRMQVCVDVSTNGYVCMCVGLCVCVRV